MTILVLSLDTLVMDLCYIWHMVRPAFEHDITLHHWKHTYGTIRNSYYKWFVVSSAPVSCTGLWILDQLYTDLEIQTSASNRYSIYKDIMLWARRVQKTMLLSAHSKKEVERVTFIGHWYLGQASRPFTPCDSQ